MKKLISVLLALTLALSFGMFAFAEEDEAPVDTVGASDLSGAAEQVIGDIGAGLSDIVDAVNDNNDADLTAAIESLYDTIKEGEAVGNLPNDAKAIANALLEYAKKADVDLSKAGTDSGVIAEVVEMFLGDGGFDMNKVKDALEEIDVSKLPYGYYAVPSVPDKTTSTTPPSSTVPPVDNPDTGDNLTGVAVAVAVLAVAGGAVVAFSKKKED